MIASIGATVKALTKLLMTEVMLLSTSLKGLLLRRNSTKLRHLLNPQEDSQKMSTGYTKLSISISAKTNITSANSPKTSKVSQKRLPPAWHVYIDLRKRANCCLLALTLTIQLLNPNLTTFMDANTQLLMESIERLMSWLQAKRHLSAVLVMLEKAVPKPSEEVEPECMWLKWIRSALSKLACKGLKS